MRRLVLWPAARTMTLGLLALAASGCGSGDRNERDVVPSTDKARTALELALNAWKNGEKSGKLEGAAKGIEVVDSVWRDGAKLTNFEILRAEDKPGPRWFTVKLTLAGSAPPQEVSYAVLGLDPLWVFREEDHKKLTGM